MCICEQTCVCWCPAVLCWPEEQYRQQSASREAAGHALVFWEPDGGNREEPSDQEPWQVRQNNLCGRQEWHCYHNGYRWKVSFQLRTGTETHLFYYVIAGKKKKNQSHLSLFPNFLRTGNTDTLVYVPVRNLKFISEGWQLVSYSSIIWI